MHAEQLMRGSAVQGEADQLRADLESSHEQARAVGEARSKLLEDLSTQRRQV